MLDYAKIFPALCRLLPASHLSPMPLALLIYNLALPLALLLSLPSLLLRHRRRGGRAADLLQRLALYPLATRAILRSWRAKEARPLWLHAVSVGEVGVALKFLLAYRHAHPGTRVLFTSTTPTGHAIALKALGHCPDSLVLFSPLDLPPVAARLLDLLKPSQLVLTESELWPNLLTLCARKKIPVALINARLSPRSEARYCRFHTLARPLLSLVGQVLVPEPDDRARWEKVGIPASRIGMTGNIKYDDPPAPPEPALVMAARQILQSLATPSLPSDPGAPSTATSPILLAASTHAGEEELLGQATLALAHNHPGLVFLAAPRHAERGAEVAAQLSAVGFRVARRSQLEGPAAPPTPSQDPSSISASPPLALILDTTGELRSWLPLATLVVVGKSLLGRGGQNPAEAIQAGVAVAAGPHMENFAPLTSALHRADALAELSPELSTLTSQLDGLLSNPARRAHLVEAGRRALTPHIGATARTVALLHQPA
jgi:3-deoxy-D-manno-octulosonic-acid transferase